MPLSSRLTVTGAASRRGPGRRLLRSARALTCLALVGVAATASASAASAAGDDYGELARWGGVDATGAQQLGHPMAFGTDAVDDSVYVVDRQSSDTTTGEATFRLRKFAGLTGELLGTATFTATSPLAGTIPSVSAVAVDHAAEHVYVSVVAPQVDAGYNALLQIQVFDPDVDSGALTAPADVADGTLLDAPQPALGVEAVMAVDPSTHDVLLGGYDATAFVTAVYRYHGTADAGAQAGDPDGSWIGDQPNGVVGLAVAADGEVYVANKYYVFGFNVVDVGRLSADLTTFTHVAPTVAQGSADAGNGINGILAGDLPQIGGIDSYTYVPQRLGSSIAMTADGTLLATTIGYHSAFTAITNESDDLTSDNGGSYQRRFGVLRLAADGEHQGLLAGGALSGACALSLRADNSNNVAGYGVQAGADGKFFAPSWQPDTGTLEIAAFGPGGDGCPMPAPSLAVQANGGQIADDGTVPAGAETTLDLSASDLKNWPLLEVDWDLDGDADNGTQGDGFEVKDRLAPFDVDAAAPPLTHSATFDTVGDHPIRARLMTTAGTSTVARTVHVVEAPIAPSAVFGGAAIATAGTAVSFDASESHVNPAGRTAGLSYAWDFGDGGGFTAGSKVQTHTYAAAGTYQVRVRVTDAENGLTATSDARSITVQKAPDKGGSPAPPQPPAPQTPATPLPLPGMPPPPHDASATNLRPRLSVSKTTVTVALSCPVSKAQCSAAVTLKTVVKVKGKKKTITIGSSKATLKGGASKRLAIKLNSAGLKALKSAKKLAFTATVAATDTYGGKKTSSLKATIKQPKATKKK